MAAAVSVIVPARDADPWLLACLDGLAAQQGAPVHEVVVVDDRSTDRTGELARAHPAVTRVVAGEGTGSYAARNAGIAVAQAPVFAFTDADCIPASGWLAAGLAAIGDGADLAGGAIVTQPAGAHPSAWERYDRAVYLHQDELIEHEGFAATANLFVRRTVFEDVGPFDATLQSGGDYEFGRRATAAGHRLRYAPAASVSHRARATFLETWRLHRRLGAGWADLSRTGARPSLLADPALRISLGSVVDRAAAAGDSLRRREVFYVHAVAMAARWAGRLTGRA